MPLFAEIKVGDSKVRIWTVKNRGKDCLMLDYYWAGERCQKMIRHASQADERKARAMAREIAIAINNGRVDQLQLYLGHTASEQRIFRAALDALSGLNIGVDSACREYAAAREIIGETGTVLDAADYFRRSKPTATKKIDTSAAVEQYLTALERDGFSIRHIQDARNRLRLFAKAFHVPLAEITTADMNRWLRAMTDAAPRTRNNYRERVIAFFHWAQTEGYLRREVKTEADALKKVKAPTTIHIFTPEQAATLLEGAEEHDPRCIHYLVLGLFPGIRPQEIARMTGANIRFPHNDIEVLPAQAKGQKHRQGRRRLIPIQPNVRAWLEAYPPPEGKLVMFKTPVFVRKLAKKLKVPWHHDIMRHSAISYSVAATGNVDLVALWSGNSRDVIYESYLNQVTPAEGALYASIMPKHAPKNIVRIPGSGLL